jgi:hypothetical protein
LEGALFTGACAFHLLFSHLPLPPPLLLLLLLQKSILDEKAKKGLHASITHYPNMPHG